MIVEFILAHIFLFVVVFLIAALAIFYRTTFKLFGIIVVPENKYGQIIKRFSLGASGKLKDGKIIAANGEAGMQAKTLPPGIHFGYWFWQYAVSLQSLTSIPAGQIGLIKSLDGLPMPTGQILGKKVECNDFQDGETFLRSGGIKGRQTAYLTSGLYRINSFLFQIECVPMVSIPQGMVGIITTLDGQPLPKDQIAGEAIAGHNNFQNPDEFLNKGGSRGLQSQVILAGSYNINPWFAKIDAIEMTEVPIGSAGVVISFFGPEGKDTTGIEFGHGNIVNKGEKGVWNNPYDPGRYAINTSIMKVVNVPTTNIVLNWANARTESHNLDKNLSTIKVRSKDGFEFNVDVSQIIHIPSTEASKVIARFGSVQNLVSQVLEPTVGNYFRNSAQAFDAIDFLKGREERQKFAKEHISKILGQYNVTAVDTLIGDFDPPKDLMKTLTERKIAEELNVTYKKQMEAQTVRQELEKQTAIADLQADIQRAEQGVTIAKKNAEAKVETATGDADSIKLKASADAEMIKVTGNAEAGKIEAIGKATAEAYEGQVKAMGSENYAMFKIFELIAKEKIKITPEVIVGSSNGSGSSLEGLLGLQLLNNTINKNLVSPSISSKEMD